MPQQTIKGYDQINTGTVQRPNMDITTLTKAVVTHIATGTGIDMQWTGVDVGTGKVTLSISIEGVQDIVGAMIGTTTGIGVVYDDGSGVIQYEIEDAYITDLVGGWIVDNYLPRGVMYNGKLSVTVSSNDLVVTIKTIAGADPSNDSPVYIRIGDTVRTITAATSFTLADGTNWFNAGSAELGTKEIDYFAYLVWDSNSSVVAISASRIPYGNLVSDFSGTTTNEKYLVNHANFTSTDEVEVIGRFAATLSLSGTSHLWTVPTFTAINLIQRPIYETRVLDFLSTKTAQAGSIASIVITNEKYQVIGRRFLVDQYIGWTQNTLPADYIQLTQPFTFGLSANFSGVMVGLGGVVSSNVTSSGNSLYVRRYDAVTGAFTTGAGKEIRHSFFASL